MGYDFRAKDREGGRSPSINLGYYGAKFSQHRSGVGPGPAFALRRICGIERGESNWQRKVNGVQRTRVALSVRCLILWNFHQSTAESRAAFQSRTGSSWFNVLFLASSCDMIYDNVKGGGRHLTGGDIPLDVQHWSGVEELGKRQSC